MNDVINLLRAYLLKTPFSLEISKAFIISLKEQSLLQYLYPVTKNPKYKAYYVSAVVTQEDFLTLQEEITKIFNENSLKHFFIKGSVLNTLYPDKALRTRGDIDLVVEEASLTKASNLLKANGYLIKDDEDCLHHLTYVKNNLEVELHFSLFDLGVDGKYASYFKNPFSFCIEEKDYLYKLKVEEHFIYCICHFAKHLKYGAGIRYILDFYYMLKLWQMDKEYLYQKLKELKLFILYENIINVIKEITNEILDEVELLDVQFFIDYMLSKGIHGADLESAENPFIKNRDNRFKYIIAKVFMTNKTYRMSQYPRLGKHWYTYPICLIHHLYYLLTHRLIKFFKMLFSKKSKEDKKRKQIFQKLGI